MVIILCQRNTRKKGLNTYKALKKKGVCDETKVKAI